MSERELAVQLLLEGVPQADVMRRTGIARNVIAGIAFRLREKGAMARRTPKPKEEKSDARKSDEAILGALRSLALGFGCSASLRATCDQVVRDDLALSGEPKGRVRLAYRWWTPRKAVSA